MFNRPGVTIMRFCICLYFINCVVAIIGGALFMSVGIDKGNGLFIFLSILIILLFPLEAYIIVLPIYCLGQICAHIEDMRNIEMKRENPEYSEKTDSKYGLIISHYIAQEKIIERREAKKFLLAMKTKKERRNEILDKKKQEVTNDNEANLRENTKKKEKQFFNCGLCCEKNPIEKKYVIFYLNCKFNVCPNCIKKLIEGSKDFSILKKPK